MENKSEKNYLDLGKSQGLKDNDGPAPIVIVPGSDENDLGSLYEEDTGKTKLTLPIFCLLICISIALSVYYFQFSNTEQSKRSVSTEPNLKQENVNKPVNEISVLQKNLPGSEKPKIKSEIKDIDRPSLVSQQAISEDKTPKVPPNNQQTLSLDEDKPPSTSKPSDSQNTQTVTRDTDYNDDILYLKPAKGHIARQEYKSAKNLLDIMLLNKAASAEPHYSEAKQLLEAVEMQLQPMNSSTSAETPQKRSNLPSYPNSISTQDNEQTITNSISQKTEQEENRKKIADNLELGNQLLEKNEYRRAISAYEVIQGLDPLNQIAKKKISFARKGIQKEIAKLLKEVEMYTQPHEYPIAINKLNDILRIDAGNTIAKEKLNEIQNKQDEHKLKMFKTQEEFDELLATAKKNIQNRNFDDAIKTIDKGEAQFPNNSQLNKLREQVNNQKDKHKLNELIARVNKNLQNRNFDDAITILDQGDLQFAHNSNLIELRKRVNNQIAKREDRRKRLARGTQLFNDKKYSEARKVIRKVLDDFPTDPEAKKLIRKIEKSKAIIAENRKKKQTADKYIENGVNLLEKGSLVDAKKEFQNAKRIGTEQNSSDAESYLSLISRVIKIHTLIEKEEYDQAIKICESAEQNTPVTIEKARKILDNYKEKAKTAKKEKNLTSNISQPTRKRILQPSIGI